MMKLVADKTARVGAFSEGRGRAAHVYGALEFDRLYSCVSLLTGLEFDRCHSTCQSRSSTWQTCSSSRDVAFVPATHAPESGAWQVDAQASDGIVEVEGWRPVQDVKLTPRECAVGLFTKGVGQSCRLIAALKARAALIALVVLRSKLTHATKAAVAHNADVHGQPVQRLRAQSGCERLAFPVCNCDGDGKCKWKTSMSASTSTGHHATTTRKRTGFRMGTARGSPWTNKGISISQVFLGSSGKAAPNWRGVPEG